MLGEKARRLLGYTPQVGLYEGSCAQMNGGEKQKLQRRTRYEGSQLHTISSHRTYSDQILFNSRVF
jgi:hypothetical protein